MSGSDTGLIVGLQQQQQQQHNNIRMPFTSPDSTAVYKPNISAAMSPTYQSSGGGGGDGSPGGVMVSMAGAGGAGEPMVKRKRGRPRKYGPDGTMALGLSPTPPSVTVTQSAGGGGGFSSPPPTAAVSGGGGGGGGGGGPTSSLKKARGRPPGSSSKKQQFEAFGSAGFGFTPHVITVKAGEDVSSKIMSFSQHGPRAVCVLSANGAISNVTLRQPATSGGTVTYEGRYEILSLSGSFLLSENGGQRSRTGGLSVSLSGTDGRVLGGGVAGLLTAASPVQVVVGSFIADGRKEPKSTNRAEPSPTFGLGGGAAGPNSPPSRGTLSESSGGPGSPINQSTGACNNNSNPQGMSGMPWK